MLLHRAVVLQRRLTAAELRGDVLELNAMIRQLALLQRLRISNEGRAADRAISGALGHSL